MKRDNGWLTNFFVAVGVATFSRGFIYRLVCGDYYVGILLILTLCLPTLLDWMWHLPLRKIDVAISGDPLKPNPSLLCHHIRDVFRRFYSEGGNYLVYIAPMPDTGMRIAFNLGKQRVEAKCGTSKYPADESIYQLPPFYFDNSPVIYRLDDEKSLSKEGVYLCINAKRGERIKISQLSVNKYALIIAEGIVLCLGLLFDVWLIVCLAILIHRLNLSNLSREWQIIFAILSIIVAISNIYGFCW